MAIIHNPDSEFSRELQKWNTQKRHGGFGPNGHEEFPKMMYQARPRENGKVMCGDPSAAMGDAIGEAFSRSCQLIVHDQDEADKSLKQGWYDTPDLALVGYEDTQKSMADIAAMRHFSDQRMGETAKAEAKAVDDATHLHVPSIPAPRKRGRPKRVVVHN
jgi:hypothetical protein|tara:strand:+ start:2732 stop:3211 length:480 start_codon:yes stop_codon:yes gene_type:complete